MPVCPVTGFGNTQILDREISVAKITIISDQMRKEQKRYPRAVKIVSDHLDEHVKEVHAGSWLSAYQILNVQKVMLEDENMDRKELRGEGKPFSPDVTLGAMIEIPSATIAVAALLDEVDFVSVGTNDLLQYFMAADRDNEDLLKYGDYINEAFLYLLRFIIERADESMFSNLIASRGA